MPYQRVALFVVALYMLAGFAYCSRCDISQPEQNCLTLWKAFQDSLLNQNSSNLLRLDLMFNQPSRLTPTVVKVIYNYSITHSNSTCVDKNGSVVLGWTAKSLYIYFHVSLINQLQFQLPFLIMKWFESYQVIKEPDVDDYLWVGDNQKSLPELYLTLNVTFTPENNTLDGCSSNEDITNALAELNHWLRAFAKVALQGIEDVNPDYKGYTLPQSGVEPYNYMYNENEKHGQILFLYMYIVSAGIAYVFGYFLYKLLLELYDSEVKRTKHFPFPPLFRTVTFLASVYIVALYLTDMGYYCYNWNSYKAFKGLKMIAMIIPVVVFIAVKISSNIEFWVGLLTFDIALLILSIFPTLLLFFAHPMNTFTLLVIHLGLFYIEIILGMLVIEQCYKCEHTRNQRSCTEQACNSKRSNILPSMVAIVAVSFVYVIFMWFYHVLFLRSLIKNLAFDIFSKYIPSVVIAVFGYMSLIQKGIFSNKDKEYFLIKIRKRKNIQSQTKVNSDNGKKN